MQAAVPGAKARPACELDISKLRSVLPPHCVIPGALDGAKALCHRCIKYPSRLLNITLISSHHTDILTSH